MRIDCRRLANLLPVAVGTSVFLCVIGYRVLDPTNIAWLEQGDPSQHYLGWLFFRNSGPSFPFGLNPGYGLEISSAIALSDSNPLLAFLFKPFSSLLPVPFQYFGIWVLFCFILQAWFAWKLIGLASDDKVIRLLGAAFFCFSPPMIARMMGHLSLSGHFLIVAALYLALHPRLQRRVLAWGLLLAAASLVHAYLLAITGLLWLADLAAKVRGRDLLPRQAANELLAILAVVGVCCWQAGYFSVGAGASSGGFGVYRMNLLALFNSGGWSYVLGRLPEADGEYEGFCFLGLGILFMSALCLPVIASQPGRLHALIRRYPVLVLALVLLTLFALSNRIGIGSLNFPYPLPRIALGVANVFRASGRMFWPVFYVLVLVIIYLIIRGYRRRTAILLLALALVVQIADTRAAWSVIRAHFMVERKSAWSTSLVDPFWASAADKYRKLRWITPENNSPHWKQLSAFAGTHGLATDAVYLARVGDRALALARRKALDAQENDAYEEDALYVLDDQAFLQAARKVDARVDGLARIDGLNVLAPGWNGDGGQPPLNSVRAADLLSAPQIGQRMPAGIGGSANSYLAQGWSQAETWGTWSDGESATIRFPVDGRVSAIRIEARAFLPSGHSGQAVAIRINDVLVATTRLSSSTDNKIDVAIPDELQVEAIQRKELVVRMALSDAVSPKELGLSGDARRLAIGLHAITVF